MKRVTLALMATMLVALNGCKKAEKTEELQKPKIWMLSTFAGNNLGNGYLEGPKGLNAINGPFGLKADASGNIYFAEQLNHVIRKITPDGTTSLFAGKPGEADYIDGPASTARFSGPKGLAIDVNGNLFVSEDSRIRKITPDGTVSTFVGGPTSGYNDGIGTAAKFSNIQDIAIDASNNLYIGDGGNFRIRKVTPTGVVTTIAGTGSSGGNDGPVATARIRMPAALAVDPSGTVYFSEYNSLPLRKLSTDGIITTLIKALGYNDGITQIAAANFVLGMACDPAGNIYFTDANNNLIRKVTFNNGLGTVSTFAGIKLTSQEVALPTFRALDGIATESKFAGPQGIAIDKQGNIYFSLYGNTGSSIKKVSMEDDPRASATGKNNFDWSKPSGWK